MIRFYYQCEVCGFRHLRDSKIGEEHQEFEINPHIRHYEESYNNIGFD